MLLNLHVITFLCIISFLLNISLPIIEKPKFTIFLITQFLVLGTVYIYGWVNSRNAQHIPISVAFLLRILQAFIFVFWRKDITWVSFGVLCFLDILFLLLLVLDKSTYKYEYHTVEEDEFFNK